MSFSMFRISLLSARHRTSSFRRLASTHIEAPVRQQEQVSQPIDPITERCELALATANVISVTKELAASKDTTLLEFGSHFTRYCAARPSISDSIVQKQVKIMFDALVNAKQLAEAESLLEQCSDRLQSDRGSDGPLKYHLVREYAKQGKVEAVQKMVSAMYGANDDWPLWTQASLVQALARSKRANEAVTLFEKLANSGLLSSELLAAIMEVLPRLNYKKALKLLEQDCAKWKITPTASMYDDVIEQGLKGPTLDQSIGLIKKQIEAGYVFRSRILWLVGARTAEVNRPELTEQALQLWLQQHGYQETFAELLQEPARIDKTHDKLVHTLIMYSCARNQEDSLMKLLNYVEAESIPMSERVSSHLVTYFSSTSRKPSLAVKYLKHICDNEYVLKEWKKQLAKTIKPSSDKEVLPFRLTEHMNRRFLALYGALEANSASPRESILEAEKCLEQLTKEGTAYVSANSSGKRAKLEMPKDFVGKRRNVLQKLDSV